MPVSKTAMQQSDNFLARLHIDGWLLAGLFVLMTIGLFTIYSASGQDMALIQRQVIR
ncbi:MAG: rod shape-determining protein RodA, partial [Glaciecola sp.]|nr:rod shape-determining protein RodA [Glaciecola sp.]